MIGKQDEIGTLKPGVDADVSVLADQRGKFLLRDNEKNQVVAERLLQPLFCLRAGKRYDADASILPEAIAASTVGNRRKKSGRAGPSRARFVWAFYRQWRGQMSRGSPSPGTGIHFVAAKNLLLTSPRMGWRLP